jgi:serine/threonine protein kinase
MNEVDTFHQRYSMVESMILIFDIKHLIKIFFTCFRYSTKSDIWAIGVTMYEVIKLKNVFSGNNKDEIIKKTKNILKSGTYPKLEESEELYDKEMINTINLMLNVIFYFFYFSYLILLIFFFYSQLIEDQKLKIFYNLIIYRKYLENME